jgi:hypothetical protein
LGTRDTLVDFRTGTRCRDYWITERKFAARNGSKRKKKKRTGEGYFKQVSEKLVTFHDD